MSPERDKEFEKNMSQLLQLLRKIMKDFPMQGAFGGKPGSSKDGAINMNICVFSFLPIPAEEMDEWEEIYEQYLHQDHAREGRAEEFTTELNAADLEFLKDHGIRF